MNTSPDSLTSTLGRSALVSTPQIDCVICFKRGHRCKATHTDEDGRSVCVFCLDGEPCPVMQRNPTTPPAAPAPKRRKDKTVKQNTVEAQRTCPAPSKSKDPNSPPCGAPIRPSNKSGFCRLHFHLSKQKHPPVAAVASRAPRAPRVNGNHHPMPQKPYKATGAKISLQLTEGQLNNLFLRLPVEDRALIVSNFIAGGQ